MNHDYLLEYISYHLHTFVRHFDAEGKLIESVCGIPDFKDTLLSQNGVIDFLLKRDETSIPLLSLLGHEIVYATIHTSLTSYLIGPLRPYTSSSIQNQLPDVSLDSDWLETVSYFEFEDLIDYILLLYNLLHSSTIKKEPLIEKNFIKQGDYTEVQKKYTEIMFEHHEMETKHNPYDQEVREISSIRNGDLEQLKKSWAEDYSGTLGVLAKTRLRNYKNIGIVLITLASRAAIEGGLLPEIAFSLSDSYIMKIEEFNDLEPLESFIRQAEYEYAKMVHDLKEETDYREGRKKQSYWTNQCKDYIFQHLHGKIQVTDIANALHVNQNYLSETFSKCEGISLTKFILHEKVKLAKNLLVYSKYTYSEIASYLGFSSQSHFGAQFKKVTGTTPKKYREEHGMKEFE